jgi:hypothetical protein
MTADKSPSPGIELSSTGARRRYILFNLIDKKRASQYFPAFKHAAGVSDRLPSGDRAAIAR